MRGRIKIMPVRARTTLGFATVVALFAQPANPQAYEAPPTAATAASPDASPAHPELWPQIAWPELLTGEQEARVQALVKTMSLPCKIGQIIQADILKVTPEDVSKFHLGSVLNGGTSGPNGNDLAPAREWLALADAYYDASMAQTEGCPAIPISWGIDAVHGQNNIIGATLFPHNVGLGATRDPLLIERIGAAAAREIQVTGQDWTFAPTIAVPQDWRWGRSYEGFGSDPALVATMGAHMIRGLQGPPSTATLLQSGHVAATPKHFLGDGGTTDGRDQGNTQVSEDKLRWAYGTAYAAAIEQGAASIMVSYSSWNGTKMHGNKSLLSDVLKDRMGFGGLIITDWNGHAQIPGCKPDNCPQVMGAGVDMIMIPDRWKELYANMLKQAQDGTIAMARLDDAVARTLRMKMHQGLFEAGRPSARPLGGKWDVLGAPEHRAVAREAVAKSLVLLKNDGVLPLKPSARILVAGDGADDISRQSGGWTVSWQGTDVPREDFPGATSIWKGIDAAVRAAGGQAELAPLGDYKARPDAAIVVFGEMPYAEGVGDIPSLQLRHELHGPLATMKRLRAQGIPVVAVFLSGRPLFVNAEMNAANGFVAAWLPGSEGEGVADMLFAGAGRDFQGRLPVPWPVDATPYAPALFGYGYGLTLAQGARPWTALSEDPGLPALGIDGLMLEGGAPRTGWTMQARLGDGAPARIDAKTASLLSGRLAIRDAKDPLQPGARHFALKAGATPLMLEMATDKPIDIRRDSFGPIMVVMTVKFDAAPGADWTLGMACGETCGKSVGFPALAGVQPGQWVRVGMPLRCFGIAPADLTHVERPFRLATAGAASFSLAEVALGTLADVKATCPS
jgi:beta-glucosidase